MTNDELVAYAVRGMRAEAVERAASVRLAMTRMKESLDKNPADGATQARFQPVIDNLMAALVSFAESIERAEQASRATYTKGGADIARAD